MFANQDQWNKQKAQEQSGQQWTPPKAVEQEEERGSSGVSSQVSAPMQSSPWSMRGGGWNPRQRRDEPNIGGFAYQPIPTSYHGGTGGQRGGNEEIIIDPSYHGREDDAGRRGDGYIEDIQPDKPTEPTTWTPPAETQGNAWNLPTVGMGVPITPQQITQFGQLFNQPTNDWRTQGVSTLSDPATIASILGVNTYNTDQALTQLQALPSFQQIYAPSSPAVANGFPDRVQPDPNLVAGVDSFTGAGGTQVNMETKMTPSNLTAWETNTQRQKDMNMALQELYRVPSLPPKTPPKPPTTLAKKSWGGYGGGGGGGGGGRAPSWQDFLGNMNWKI